MKKEHEALLFNSLAQILENQIENCNTVINNASFKRSNELKTDLLKVISDSATINNGPEKEAKIPKDVLSIFDYWKERGLTQHVKINGFIIGIKTGLKNTSCSELMDCIDRYSLTFFDKESSLSYVWSIDEFCSSKYKKFETDERVEANYYKRYNGNQKTQSAIISNETAFDVAEQAIQSRNQELF